jgi:hypothetical protein
LNEIFHGNRSDLSLLISVDYFLRGSGPSLCWLNPILYRSLWVRLWPFPAPAAVEILQATMCIGTSSTQAVPPPQSSITLTLDSLVFLTVSLAPLSAPPTQPPWPSLICTLRMRLTTTVSHMMTMANTQCSRPMRKWDKNFSDHPKPWSAWNLSE